MARNLQGRTENNNNAQLEERKAREQFMNEFDDSKSDEMA